MLDKNLKQHCKEVQGKGKLMKGRKTFMFSTAQKEPSKNKGKSANEESLDSSCSFVQSEESENNANTLNIASISKSGNSAKSSIVMASSTEFADGHGKKVDMKFSEISKLNPKLFDEINSHKQANELPKSEEHFNKLINQLNQCKTIADLCESFNYLSYISLEQSLVCNIYVMYPSQGGSQTPGRLNYNIIIDNIDKSKVLPRDFSHLKTHVKRHFENEVHLKNDKKNTNERKRNVKHENMQTAYQLRDYVM